MAKVQQAKAAREQIIMEKGLGVGAVVWMVWHMLFTFVRHFLAPENAIGKSSVAMALFSIERWFGFALIMAAVCYLVFTLVKYPRTWYRVQDFFRRLRCKEMGVLLGLYGYYLLVCVVHTGKYTNIFPSNDVYLMDLLVSFGLLFALPLLMGKNTRKIVDGMLHIVMVVSTGFIVWALWHVFQLHVVELPNGLQLGMTEGYSLYAGVNQNIGAAIGTTMVMICLYMLCSQRWPLKIAYGLALIPHTIATLLTNSRGNFLALWIAFSLMVFMLVWNRLEKKNLPFRIAASVAAAAGMAVLFYFLRGWVFEGFEAITHFKAQLTGAATGGSGGQAALDAVRENLELDDARAKIWHASLAYMVSSPRAFFFGVPGGLIPQTIQDSMAAIYGTSGMYAHAHNMILQTGLMLGVPGMLGFLALLVMLFVRSLRVVFGKGRAHTPGAWALPIGIAAMLAVNMFEPFLMFYLSVMGCLFFLYCGWVVALDRGEK